MGAKIIKNTGSSKALILADFEYVILHKISKLLIYVSLLLLFWVWPSLA